MIAAGTLPTATDPLAAVTDRSTDERWYPYPPTMEQFESVTYLIGATESKAYLRRWHGKTAAGWCVDNLDLLAKVLATEGRDAAIALGMGEADRIRDLKADVGTYLHDVGERLILWAREPKETGHLIAYPPLPDHLVTAIYNNGGEEIPVPQVADMMADGWVQFVTDFGLGREDFLACEMPVYHPGLKIAGTVDTIVRLHGYGICGRPGAHCHLGAFCPGTGTHLVAQPGNTLTLLVDFKTGKNPAGTWKEQIAAYSQCPECRPDKTDDRVQPMPHIDAGAVLHLRPEYPGGYLLMLVSTEDENEAWERFLGSMDLLRGRRECRDKPGTSVRALREDGTMPGPRLCDLAAEGYGNSLAPLREALGAACELEDLAAFTATELLAVKGIGGKRLDTIRQMLADHGLSLAEDAPTGKVA